ncbi:unnamed protein product, partial [Effrenium voratum]
VPSRPLGSGVELESQVVQLRNCLETLERRLEEELRSFLAISDKRLQVREEQLRGVGETLQASADAALEQLGRRVDVRLRELERAGMAPMALDEVWDCIKRLQNDCQDLDSKLRRATSTDEIAERFQEMERAQAQRLEDRLATQERRLSDYRVQLQGSNREFLQAIEHRCEMLEKNFWEGQSDRGDVVEAVFKRLAEAAPIRELHDEKINSSNYDKEVQRSRLAAAEAKLSKFAALESKVDFMESQMSQQLEEQAQQFRNVGELQQRLVQKLSATEASCQRVEAQGSVLQAKLQAQMEEDRDRHSSSFESMQLRLVQRLEEVEGRSSRYATRSEKDLVDNMTALAQKISEDNAAAQRQADKRLHSIEERCDQVVQMARVQMERGVQDLKVEAEATKNALEMDLHRAERFMQEMGSKISSQEAQLLRMSEMDVQRSRLETLESKVNEVQGEQRTLRDVKAIVDAHKLQADRRHGDLEISMTSLEEQLRGREQRRSNDVEEQRARYEGLESRLTEVQVGQVRQNTTLENLTATLTNLEPKTVGQIADMARLEQAILVLQQQQRNQSFATTMGSLDRSGVTEPASPTRASSPVGRRVEDRVRRLEDAVDLLPPRLQDRLRALENASGSSELRSSSAASAAVNAVAASLAPQLEELRTRLGLLGQQQGDLDSRLRRAESRERPAAHQPAMQEPVAQPAREPAVDSRNASPKNSPEISELEARLSRLEDHLLTLDSLDSSGMETSALPSGATLQVTLDCIGDSEEPISSSDIRSALQEVESVELLRVDFPDRDRAAVCWVSTGSGAAETRLRRLLEDSDSVLRQRLGAEEAERKIREEQERQRQQRKDEDERRKKEEEQDAREIAAQKKREQEQRMRDDEQRRKEADEKNRKEAEEARIKEAEEAEAEEKKRKEAEAQKKREAEEQMRKEAEEQERREAMEAEEQRKRQEAEEAEEARQAQQKAQEAKQKQLEAARAAAGVVQPKEHTPTSQAGAPKPGFEKRRARVTGLPPTARASARSKEEEIKKVFAAIDTTSSGALTLDDLQSFLCDFLGFGQAEVAAFHQRFGEGDAMSLEGFKKGYASLNPFTLTKRHKELIIRKSGSLSSAGLQALQLEELEDSEVYVCELTNTAYVDVCKRCAILIGPSETSVFVRDCEDCVFWIAAQQLRTRDCKRCSFFLYSKTEPVIESSEDLAFAPWSASYPCSKAHFEKLGFNPEKNLWNAIYDFSGKVGKCNWRILGLEETARLQIELEDPPPKPEPENPAAPLTYEALCAEPLESGESCGTSVGQIPQTRPALPAAPPMDFKEVQQIVVQDGGKLAALEQLVRLRRKDSSSQPSTPGALAMATLAGKTLMKAGGGSAEMEAVAKATPASASSALGMARLAGQTLMEAGGGSAETEAVAKATPASASSALGMARLAGQTLMEAGGGSAETEAVAKATPASASSALGMARLAGQTLMEAGTTVHGTMAVEEEDSSGDSPRPAPSKAPKPAAKPAAKPDAAQVRKLLGESSDEESEEAKPSTAPSASAALPKLSLGKAMPKPAVNRAHPVAVDSEEDDDSDIEEAMKKAAAAASASRTSPLGGSSAAKSAPTSLRLSPQSRAEASVPVVDDEDDDSGNDFDEDIDLPM